MPSEDADRPDQFGLDDGAPARQQSHLSALARSNQTSYATQLSGPNVMLAMPGSAGQSEYSERDTCEAQA